MRNLRVLDLPEVWKELMLSQICLKENGDREESEVSVVQVRNNSVFIEQGFHQAR